MARNRAAGTALAEQYGFEWQPALGAYRPGLIVNVTPIGMAGAPEANDLAFPESTVLATEFVFDVVALPAHTPLIRLAGCLHKPTILGAEVIVLQAVEQFRSVHRPTPGIGFNRTRRSLRLPRP